jgi:hypothetical protein
MDYLRRCLEENQKNKMISYMNENKITEEMANLICVAIINNFSKNDCKSIESILELPLGKNENTFNLRVRLATFLNKSSVITLYNYAIEYDIKIKKRTISPIIEFAISLEDSSWLRTLYNFAIDTHICLSQTTYLSILNYWGNKNLPREFYYTLKHLVSYHDILDEKISESICHFYTFRVQEAKMTRQHMCKKCNTTFCQKKMTSREQYIIKNIIKESLALNDPRFNNFCDIVSSNHFEDIEYIIDGANVGYFEQRPDLGGTLSYSNIDKVIRQLPGKKKVFLHEMHDKKNTFLDNWKKQDIVYFTPRGMNDDLFWLYLGIHNIKSKIISNDNIGDHYFKCSHSKSFMKWRDLTMVKFKKMTHGFEFKIPKPYRAETQYSELKWHIPIKNGSWLCIDN